MFRDGVWNSTLCRAGAASAALSHAPIPAVEAIAATTTTGARRLQ
jgi:hypothetical protein